MAESKAPTPGNDIMITRTDKENDKSDRIHPSAKVQVSRYARMETFGPVGTSRTISELKTAFKADATQYQPLDLKWDLRDDYFTAQDADGNDVTEKFAASFKVKAESEA